MNWTWENYNEITTFIIPEFFLSFIFIHTGLVLADAMIAISATDAMIATSSTYQK